MTLTMRLVIFIIGILLFITILELVRRKKFREDLSIVWLLIGVGLMLAPLGDFIIDPLAFKLGISHPPALIFMLVFFLFVIAMLYFSIVVSDLKGKNKELSQKIALMEYKIDKQNKEENN